MALLVHKFSFTSKYCLPHIECVFKIDRLEDKELFFSLFYAYLKNVNLDLASYFDASWSVKSNNLLYQKVCLLVISIEDLDILRFNFTIGDAYPVNVFALARAKKMVGQEEVCREVNIGRTTLSRLENDYNYSASMRKSNLEAIVNFYRSELQYLNYFYE